MNIYVFILLFLHLQVNQSIFFYFSGWFFIWFDFFPSEWKTVKNMIKEEKKKSNINYCNLT